MKNKGSLRHWTRPYETGRNVTTDAVWCYGVGPVAETGRYWENAAKFKPLTNVDFSVLINVPGQCKMITLEESKHRWGKLSVLSLQLFCISTQTIKNLGKNLAGLTTESVARVVSFKEVSLISKHERGTDACLTSSEC